MSECLLSTTAALHRPHSLKQPMAERLYKQKHAQFTWGGPNVSAHSPGENTTEALKGPLTGVLASFLCGSPAVNLALERN